MEEKDGYAIEIKEEEPALVEYDFPEKMNPANLKWTYYFTVRIRKSAGSSNKVTRTAFDTAFELYRKAVSKEWGMETCLTITGETGESVYVESISEYRRWNDAKNFVNEYKIAYKHLEIYT